MDVQPNEKGVGQVPVRPNGRIAFGPYVYDERADLLLKYDIRIKLQPKPRAILRELLRRPGELVRREELRDLLWPDGTFVDFDLGVNVAIKKLRDALSDSAEQPHYVETAPGEGYRFIAAVEHLYKPRPADSPISLDSNGEDKVTGNGSITDALLDRWRHFVPRTVIAFSSLVIAAVLLSTVAADRQSKTGVSHDGRAVLIMKLQNRTGDAIFDGSLNYVLESSLSDSRFVNVVAAKRVNEQLQYMRKPTGPISDLDTAREVCLRDADIQAVLAPRIEKIGSDFEVSSAIINCASGETVAVPRSHVTDVGQVIPAVENIAVRVRIALGEYPAAGGHKLERATTTSLDALKLFTEARAQLATENPTDIDGAIRLLKNAVIIDPNFAMAWITLAESITSRSEYIIPPLPPFTPNDAGPYYEKALELADKATDREKYEIIGSYHQNWSMDLEKAIAAFETLHTLYPDDVRNMSALATAYMHTGRADRAERLYLDVADRQKKDFEVNWDSWETICGVLGQPGDAERLRMRAMSLATPEIRKQHPDEVAELETMPIIDLLNQGRVDLAMERQRERVDEFQKAGEEKRLFLAGYITKIYFDTGQLKLAEEWSRKTGKVDLLPHINLAAARGDIRTVRKLVLEAASKKRYMPLRQLYWMVDFGVRAEVMAKLPALRHERRIPSGEALVRAELDRSEGRLVKAISEFRAIQPQVHSAATWFEPIMLDSLARAQEDAGDTQGAIETLEISARRPLVPLAGWADWPAQVRLRLTRLYRKVGRVPDAERIEGELRNLYRYADPDYLVASQLRRLPSGLENSTLARTSQ